MSHFPIARGRRLRATPALRRLARETSWEPADLIAPLFIVPGQRVREPIPSLPGHFHWSADRVVEEARALRDLGVGGLLLFGLPDRKDARGTAASDEAGEVQRAVRTIKEALPDLLVITDVCLCEYTDHGHCGLIEGGRVVNDATLPRLAEVALSHVRAGADVVAPSDMMDGRVAAIREALDRAGFEGTPILSYAAKYASAFYGPFRDAAGSAPAFGDRRSYQMDPANAREALREVALDVAEGADLVMVKPGLPCLDVIRRVRDRFDLPVVAYQVSGEYAMIKAAAERGWLDERAAVEEAFLALRRAGADRIVTYYAREAIGWRT